jgi:putative ABC transport system permease protein
MFRNYFKIALRHLQKNKLYALVNILGLATGIAGCLLIGLYIFHELSFDRFHKNADRIARVTWHYNFGDAENKTSSTGTKVGPEFTRRFPEVQAYVRLLKFQRVLKYGDKQFDEKNFLYADSAFFSVFSFPLLKGSPTSVLDAPQKMVITETAAKKYFGTEDPVGKTVRVGGTKDFLITGVTADVPQNSQIKFEFIGSFTSLTAAATEKYNEANYLTFLLLKDKGSIGPLQSRIDRFFQTEGREEFDLQGAQFSTFKLEPLTRVHLHSELDGFEPNNNITYIYVLAIMAFLILLIACMNYTNLSSAQYATRTAEVGMRKVMGAGKAQVFNQFIAESLVLSFLSACIAFILAILLLPYFNSMSGKKLESSVLLQPFPLACLLVLCILVAFAGGAYPAFVLSNSKVIRILKSGFSFTGRSGLRKSLIVLQFAISIFLIIATMVILQQLSYIRNKDLGYVKEQVVVLPVDRVMQERYDDIKKALASSRGVQSIAGAYEDPTHIGWADGISTPGGTKQVSVNALPGDEDIVKSLGLNIVAGSDFNYSDVQQFDTSNDGANLRYAFMLNESAVKALGWTPQQAIGKTIIKGREGTVKAVVKDFHFRSLHEPIKPLLIFMDKRMAQAFFIRIASKGTTSTLQALEKTWKERVPHRPFEYHFLDEDYAALYKTEERMASVFASFSGLAIILACLGLFALTAYTMVRRTKEIGIRKVLGATVADILGLVSKDFLKLVVLALLLAAPLAFIASSKWLEGFTYRINISWWIFGITGVVTLLIAFLTISAQAIRTALANPVKNLKVE